MKTLCTLLTLASLSAGTVFAAPQSASKQPATPQTAVSGDWAPELLYGILNSHNPQADEELYRAAFAAGPAIIPQLQSGLKNSLTADFAARSLALIGGPDALKILSGLVDNSQNPDLRQYYYGALGEFSDARATNILLDAIRRSDRNDDRSLAETAIIALTVHTDAALAAKLREMGKQIGDVVIQDDLENAADVIEARAKYLATPAGKKAAGSINQTVRTYFIPALEGAPDSPQSAQAGHQKKKPAVDIRIENLTFSPDGERALAHVIFETPDALANYEMVLQKKLGDWTLASVWLGAEQEKAGASGGK